jgi:alginate O-acetyltransferase complex protein AlgI
VFFRATDMSSAISLLTTMHSFGSGVAMGAHAMTIFMMTTVWVLLVHVMDFYVIKGANKLEQKPWLFWFLILLGQTICILIGEPSNEFIYFQF